MAAPVSKLTSPRADLARSAGYMEGYSRVPRTLRGVAVGDLSHAGQAELEGWVARQVVPRCCSRTGTAECGSSVGVAVYLDDLRVFDSKDLVEEFGRCRPGPLGLAGHAETEHDGVAVDLHAFDGRPDAVGQKASVPVKDLRAVAADASPVDLGVQERPQQVEVEVAVGGFEVSGDVGPEAGADR